MPVSPVKSKRPFLHPTPYTTPLSVCMSIPLSVAPTDLATGLIDPSLQYGHPDAQVVSLTSHAIVSTHPRVIFSPSTSSVLVARHYQAPQARDLVSFDV